MKEGKDGIQRKVFHFNPENYSEALAALKKIKPGSLIGFDVDRASGTLIIETPKGTSLVAFDIFQVGQGEKMDKRLKCKVTPMGPAKADVLHQIQRIVLGDYAKKIRRVIFKDGEYLTILFASKEGKDNFINLMKSNFIAEVVLKS